MASATANWDILEDGYYRSILLYSTLFEDLASELADHVVVGAPYGGALALYRNESKLQAFRGSFQSKTVNIFTSAGKLIRRISWDKGGFIKGLGWSETEKLLVVTEDGTVRCYSDLLGEFSQFSLGHVAALSAQPSGA